MKWFNVRLTQRILQEQLDRTFCMGELVCPCDMVAPKRYTTIASTVCCIVIWLTSKRMATIGPHLSLICHQWYWEKLSNWMGHDFDTFSVGVFCIVHVLGHSIVHCSDGHHCHRQLHCICQSVVCTLCSCHLNLPCALNLKLKTKLKLIFKK